MSQDTVKVNLELATSAATEALKQFQKQTEKTTSTFDIFKGNLAANAAFDAFKNILSGITGTFSSMLDEASKAEASVKKMEVALTSAGMGSAATSQHFQKLGDEIEATTVFSGDMVESSVALLANLTALNKDGITQTIGLSADLAAALGMDLNSATEMLAKALNGNTTAFNKMGISIEKGTTQAETLANVTQALSQFQGAAVASSNTYAGALTKLDNVKGKLLESFGKLITQNPLVISGMETLTSVFLETAEFIEENRENITLFAQSLAASVAIFVTAGAAVMAYTAAVGGSSVALTGLSVAARAAWAAVTGPIGLAVAGIAALSVGIYAVVKNWDAIKAATYDAAAAVLEYTAIAAGVFSDKYKDKLNEQAQALRDKAKATRQLAEETKNQKAEEAKDTGNSANTKAEADALKRASQERLNSRKEYNANILLLQQDLNLQLAELEASHQEAMSAMNEGFTVSDLERQLANEATRLAARQEFERQALEASQNAAMAKILLMENQAEREKALEAEKLKQQLETNKLYNKQNLDAKKQSYSAEAQLNSKRIADQRSTLQTIAGMSNSSNKVLATIGKAAGLTQIAIDTPVAISKAMAAFPPPFNFAAAAAVGAAMAAQAAQLSGLAFENGGVVGGFRGATSGPDNTIASVRTGEMYLNAQQQKRLFDIADGTSSSSNSETNALLSAILVAVKQGSSININGKEIINVVKDSINSGRSLA